MALKSMCAGYHWNVVKGAISSPLREVNMHQGSPKLLKYLHHILHPDKSRLIHVCGVACTAVSAPYVKARLSSIYLPGTFLHRSASTPHNGFSVIHMQGSGERLTLKR